MWLIREAVIGVGLLAAVGMVVFCIVLPGRRSPWLACAALMGLGIFEISMGNPNVRDGLLEGSLCASVFVTVPWMVLWGWVGHRRAQSVAARTAPSDRESGP